MQAINNYIIIEPIKEDDVRYLRAKIISVGNMTEGVKINDKIYYDRRAGHGIEYNNNLYQVIKQQDVVLIS